MQRDTLPLLPTFQFQPGGQGLLALGCQGGHYSCSSRRGCRVRAPAPVETPQWGPGHRLSPKAHSSDLATKPRVLFGMEGGAGSGEGGGGVVGPDLQQSGPHTLADLTSHWKKHRRPPKPLFGITDLVTPHLPRTQDSSPGLRLAGHSGSAPRPQCTGRQAASSLGRTRSPQRWGDCRVAGPAEPAGPGSLWG